jgi:hypothetical protein
MTAAITPDIFRERFALATFDDGGVVVDLDGGSYWRLNGSAAVFCSELLAKPTIDSATAAAAERLKLPLGLAAEHLRAIAATLSGIGVRSERLGPFQYLRSNRGGYDLWHDGRHILQIDDAGELVTLVASPSDLVFRMFDYLKGVAPKILFLRGKTVLHGSAVARGGAATGICGTSGAGKTTTARSLAKYGATLISEDLLVVGDSRSGPEIFVEGEAQILRWCTDSARTITAAGATAETAPLDLATSGPTVRLASVWFLDAQHRGDELIKKRLTRSVTLERLIANVFLGAERTTSWRRLLTAAHAVSAAIDGYETSAPSGLERLDSAIRLYTTNSAS